MTIMVSDTDDWFADFSGTGLPAMALGRLPVKTLAEAQTVVSKIVGYDLASGVWTRSALLVSDLKDEFDFAAASQSVADLLPPGQITTVGQVKVDVLGTAAAHDGIVAGVNSGQLLVNYVGHGSEDIWSKNPIFTSGDVPGLTNGARLPVFVMMTCLNGLFDDIYAQCLSEDLLKAPGGGAVAVWASSALTDPAPQAVMNQAFTRALFASPTVTIGDAILAAKASVTDQDVRRSWILFGDPSMRLRTNR
jgi:hypothetical protein